MIKKLSVMLQMSRHATTKTKKNELLLYVKLLEKVIVASVEDLVPQKQSSEISKGYLIILAIMKTIKKCKKMLMLKNFER